MVAAPGKMVCRSGRRRTWRLAASGVGGCLLLLPDACGAFQTLVGGGVRRVQDAPRWRAHQDSVMAGRDSPGVRRGSRWDGCARARVLRCSAGLTTVDEPASGSDVSVRIRV